MFEHPIAKIVLAVIVLGIAIFAIRRFVFKKKENLVVLSPAQFKAAKIPVPPAPKKTVSWGPSPVDATNSPHGEWDTNRNPAGFVTNASPDFPVPADSATVPDGLTWKTKQRASPMPDATFSTGFADPAVGTEYQFGGVFGKAA